MAAIVFSRAEMDKVKGLFDAVKSNGQALAVVDKTIEMAQKCWQELMGRDSAYALQAAKDLADMSKVVRTERANLVGASTMAVGATWAALRPKVMNLWNYVRIVEQGMPPGEDLGDGFSTAIKAAAADLPNTINGAAKVTVQAAKKTVTTAAKIVKTVGTAVGDAAGSIAWATLRPLLPVIFIVGIGGAAYLYATKKGLI